MKLITAFHEFANAPKNTKRRNGNVRNKKMDSVLSRSQQIFTCQRLDILTVALRKRPSGMRHRVVRQQVPTFRKTLLPLSSRHWLVAYLTHILNMRHEMWIGRRSGSHRDTERLTTTQYDTRRDSECRWHLSRRGKTNRAQETRCDSRLFVPRLHISELQCALDSLSLNYCINSVAKYDQNSC
jgi:hypothetical protein